MEFVTVGLLFAADVGSVGLDGADAGTGLPLEYPMGEARLSGLTLVQSTFSGSGGA